MRHEGASCAGKISYASKAEALARIDKQSRRHRTRRCTNWGKRIMKAYRCPFCHQWHVGGSDETARAAKHWRGRELLDNEAFQFLPEAMLTKLGWGR